MQQRPASFVRRLAALVLDLSIVLAFTSARGACMLCLQCDCMQYYVFESLIPDSVLLEMLGMHMLTALMLALIRDRHRQSPCRL